MNKPNLVVSIPSLVKTMRDNLDITIVLIVITREQRLKINTSLYIRSTDSLERIFTK